MAVFSNLLKGQEPDLVIHFFFPGKAKLIMWIFFFDLWNSESVRHD